eukprot:CAMPEP_0198213882 /NCGR_PEP_ID=MMETSP1445-20131203/35109_1 /TAXON_ID=36898 /ORGANISM="Pyramimonas sp., Strain CCMP2087" /LENGTH=212 /DNA_ID=CAMNT_0043888735 /DNA_START=117 /DNA_END=755 /DNA_ORIENTATION=-
MALSPMRGLAYTLRNTVYVALTNECNSVTLIASRGPSFKMPVSSGFVHLDNGKEPGAQHVFDVVEDAWREGKEPPEGVVFAGVGEPLLRLDVLKESAKRIKAKRQGIQLRLNSNGLVPAKESARMAAELFACGVEAASVSLTTADPEQYAILMQPTNGCGHADVCTFVTRLVENGVQVTCSAVEHPEVDISATRSLAISLGAVAFVARPYFP